MNHRTDLGPAVPHPHSIWRGRPAHYWGQSAPESVMKGGQNSVVRTMGQIRQLDSRYTEYTDSLAVTRPKAE